MTRCRWSLPLLVLGFSPLFAEAQRPAPQDVVLIYKDGFTIRGRIHEKANVIFDKATGQAFPVFTGNFFVDDQVRNILFSRDQVQTVTKVDPKPTMLVNRLDVFAQQRNKIQPIWQFEGFTDWSDDGERQAIFGGANPRNLKQKILVLTPHSVDVGTMEYEWRLRYFTQELGPAYTRALVKQTYNQRVKLKAKKEGEKLIEIARFMHEAGWYAEAEKELKVCINDYPVERKAAQGALDELKKIRASLFVEGIEQAAKAGQHPDAMARLKTYDLEEMKDLASPRHRLLAQDLKAKYDKAGTDLEDAKRYLKQFPALSPGAPAWAKACAIIADELNFDTLGRLDNFLQFGQQHDNERKANRKLSQSAEELLAMALTGWLQGNQSAQPNPKLALRLWSAPTHILESLKTANSANRAQVVSTLKGEADLDAAVIARLIHMIPPSHPEDANKLGTKVTTLRIEAPGANQGSYLVQLPPGYHPLRAYPVLMVLHGSRESAEETLGRFSAEAAQRGIILAAPLLAGKGGGLAGKSLSTAGKATRMARYGYSADEHGLALDTLRDLRRRFQIDSDRVFLFGWEEGANMAFDVGLGHPDLFAGVIPMNANLKTFTRRYYWPNAQYLPFYIIDGERNFFSSNTMRDIFKDWGRDPFMATYVEYRGRGTEFYSAEIPFMMNWMSPKKRFHPMKEIGHLKPGAALGEEFHSTRSFDNRFYWLSSDSMEARTQHHHDVTPWPIPFPTAKFQAQLTVGNQVDSRTKNAKIWNQLDLNVSGLKQVTVWLTANMMDYSNDLKIRVKGKEVGGLRKIQPSVETMLEELYQNGDRQRLFVAKIDIKL